MKELNRGDIIYVDLGQHMYSCVQSGVSVDSRLVSVFSINI